MLEVANVGFYVFHTLLIGFNMFGWIFRRTRGWHFLAMGLTAFSWFVMGAVYGWGYCLCTDWHFQVREQLGYQDSATTYVQLLAETGFGMNMSRQTSDVLAVSIFVMILLAMAVVWSRDFQKRRRARLTINP